MIALAENGVLQNCLVNAVSEVLMTTSGVAVYQVMETFAIPKTGGVEITGAIMIQGEGNALLSLKMGKEYAMVLVASMTGLDSLELSDEDLYDGVAEVVNMIAGRIKASIEVSGRDYSLTQPFTVVGENVLVIYKEQVPQKITLQFSTGQEELYLVLTLL